MRKIEKNKRSIFSNKQRKRNSILAITLAIFIIICVLGIFQSFKRNYINNTINNLEFESKSYAEYFQKEYTTNSDYIKIIGRLVQNYYEVRDNSTIYDMKIEEIKDIFNNINEEDNFISDIYFVDNESGIGLGNDGFFDLSEINIDLRSRLWYREATVSNEVAVSDIYMDINTNQPCMTMSYAVRYEDKLLGVLAADIFVEDFNEYYINMVQHNGTKLSVVSQNGYFILDKYKKMVGRPVNEVLKENEEFDYKWEDISKIETGEIQNYRYNDEVINIYYSTVSNLGWKIFFISEYSTMKETINNTLYKYLLGGLVVYLLIFNFLMYYTTKNESTDIDTGFMKLNTLGKIVEHNKAFMRSQFLLFIDIKNYSYIKTQLNNDEYEKFMDAYSYSIRQVFKKSAKIARGREGMLIVSTAQLEIKHFKNTINKAMEKFDDFGVDFEADACKLRISYYIIEYSKENLEDFTKKLIISEETIIKRDYLGSELISLTYDELIEESREDMEKLKFLKTSLENDMIVPFFQPIINVSSGEIIKYEVLMRIKDGDNYLAPYPYILIAEKYNIIDSVDLMILEKALKLKKRVDKEDKLIFSFNLSGKVLNDKTYLRKATSIVDKYSIKHNKIDFEITETEKLYDIWKTNEILLHYVEKGYNFSVDDFGTAYSGISYLKYIPAKVIKIDGSFITNIDKNEENYYLVKSMIAMAKGYKKKTVAEFVESEEEYNTLKDLGIDLVQGYYIGRPDQELKK